MLSLRKTSIGRLFLSISFCLLMFLPLHSQVDLQLTANSFEFPSLSEKSARFTNQFIITAYNPNPESNVEYSLRMTIKGNGIEIRSNKDYDILRFNFSSSKQKVLFSNDLSAYFNFANLDFFGYNKEEYVFNGLPKGVYTICFTVVGGIYDGLNVASNLSCQNLWVTEQYPPEITYPKSDHIFDNSSKKYISWIPKHATFAPVNYEVAIFEKKKGLTNDEIFLYHRPIWTETTYATESFNSQMFSHLDEKTEYLLYVRVQSLYHDILFLNNGWSEPTSFKISEYRDDDEPPTEEAICNISPASIIINEIGNGNLGTFDEFVELVVVGSDQEDDYVDLSGYIIDDNNFALDNIGNESGHIRLGECFASIKVGTIILIYDQDNVHSKIDPANDGHDQVNDVYQVPIGSTCIERYQGCPDKDQNIDGYDCMGQSSNSEWGNYIPMRNRGDVIQVRNTTGELEHAYAWDVTNYDFLTSDKTVDFGPINLISYGMGFYLGTDWNDINNYVQIKDALATPGKPNSKENSTFINDVKNEILDNNFFIDCAVEYIVNAVGIKIYLTDATPNSSYQLYINGEDGGIHTSNPIEIPNVDEGVYSLKVINLVSGCEDQCDIVVVFQCESGILCDDLDDCTTDDELNESCECFGVPEHTITFTEEPVFQELCDYCALTTPSYLSELYTTITIHAVDLIDPFGNPITVDYDTNNEPNSPFNFPYCVGICGVNNIPSGIALYDDIALWIQANNYSGTSEIAYGYCAEGAVETIVQTNIELLRYHAITNLGDPIVIDFMESNCTTTDIIGYEVTVSSDCGEEISVVWSNGYEGNPIIIYNGYVACFDVDVTCSNGCTYTETYGECPCPGDMDESCCTVGAPCIPGPEYTGLCVYTATFDEFCNCHVQFGNDTDGDGVCDEDDICPNYDDNLDHDGDGVPDGCDICHGQDDNNIIDPDACEDPPCYAELSIDVEQYGFANCDYCLDLSDDTYDAQHSFYFSSFSASPLGEEIEVDLLTNWNDTSFCDFDSDPFFWSTANTSCPISTQNIQNPQLPAVAYSGSHAALLDFDTNCKYITSNNAGLANSCQAEVSFWVLAENFDAAKSIYLQIWKDGSGFQTIKVFGFGTDIINGQWIQLKHIFDGPFTTSTRFKITGVGNGSTIAYIDNITIKEFHGECIQVPINGQLGELNKFMEYLQGIVGFNVTNEVDGGCGPGSHILVSNATYLFNTVKTRGGNASVTHNFVSPECGDQLPGEFEYDLTANVAYCDNPSFLWSNGETTQTIHIPNEANYTVTVTCNKACEIVAGTEFEDYCVYGGFCSVECYSGQYAPGTYDANCHCIPDDQNDEDDDGVVDCLDPCPNGPEVDNNENGILDCLEPPCNCAAEPFLEYSQVGYTTVNEFCFNVESKCGYQLETLSFGGQTYNENSQDFNFPYNFNCDNPNSTNGINAFFSDLYDLGLIDDIRYNFSITNDPDENCLGNSSSYGMSIGNVPSNITSMVLGFNTGNVSDFSPASTQVGDEFQISVNFIFCGACSDPINISYLWSDGSTASTSPIYTDTSYSYAVTVTCNGNCEYIIDPTWNPLCIIGNPCDDADPCTENDEYQEDCSCQGTPYILNDVTDIDGDGVHNDCDICPDGDDNIDSDADLVPNACDECPGGNDILWYQYMNDGDPNTNIICDDSCGLEDLPLQFFNECYTPCSSGESYTLTGFTAIVPGYGQITVNSYQNSPELSFGYCNQIGQDPCPGLGVSDIYQFQYDMEKWFQKMNSQGSLYPYISGSDICFSVKSPIEFIDFYFTCGNIDFAGTPNGTSFDDVVDAKGESSTRSSNGIQWGGTCDDDNPCTYFDAYDENCECKGVYMDSDDDTVCDFYDVCPNWPDYLGCGPQFIPCPPNDEIPICEYYYEMVSFSPTAVTKSNLIPNNSTPRVIQYSQMEVQCKVQDIYEFSNGNPPTFYLPDLEIQLADIVTYDSDGDGIVDLLDMCPDFLFTGYYNASHFAGCCEDANNKSISLIMSLMFEVVNDMYDPSSTKECSQGIEGASSSCFNEPQGSYSPGCAAEVGIVIYEDEDCIIRDIADDCPVEFFINCDGECDYFKMCQETHIQLGCEIICPELPCQISYVVQLNIFDPLDPDWTPECACEYIDLGDADGDTVCDNADECPGGDDLMDTDGDKVADHCDQCPNVPGFLGDPCDDGNSCTYGDRVILDVDGNCQCAGRLVDFDGDGVYDCDGCESAIDYDGDGNPDVVEYTYFDTWDDNGNPISVVACDACPGIDDMLDNNEDGLPDCIYPPTYDIGCPADVINVPGEGIILVFSTDEVLMEDIPQPIQFSCPINGGPAAEVFQMDYLLIDNIREVDGNFEVFYSIPGFNTNFPYASVSYSGNQPCIVPEANVAGLTCPSQINIEPNGNGGNNIVIEFTIPDGYVFDLLAFQGEIQFDLTHNSGGINIISSNTIQNNGLLFPDINDNTRLEVTIGGFSGLGNINSYTGDIILPNGLSCPIAGGTTTSTCNDPDGNAISPGDPCDDEDPCTHHDLYLSDGNGNCYCEGEAVPDEDEDGFCDAIDECPGSDDSDSNYNGIPDGCECNPPSISSAYAVEANAVEVLVNNDDSGNSINMTISSGIVELEAVSISGFNHTFYGLTQGVTYTISASYDCSSSVSTEVTIPGADVDSSFCGILYPIDPTTISYLPSLNPGDTIFASDFEVIVDKASGSNGKFTGKGHLEVPYFNFVEVNAKFYNITISDNYELVAGEIVITGVGQSFIPDGFVDFLGDLIDNLEDLSDFLGDVIDILDDLSDIIDAMETMDDYNNIKDAIQDYFDIINGNPFIPGSIKTGFQDALDCFETVGLQDQAAFDACKALLQTAIDNLATALAELFNASAQITFTKDPTQSYGYDIRQAESSKGYLDTITVAGADYHIPWKSAKINGGNDFIMVENFDDDAFDANNSDISFEDALGTIYAFDENTGKLTIPESVINSKQHKDIIEVFAVERYTVSGNDSLKLAGKFNIIVYQEKEVNIHVVNVNSAPFDGSAQTSIRNDIANAYQQAGLVTNVTFEDAEFVIDPAEFDNMLVPSPDDMYTDQMKAVICPYKEQPGGLPHSDAFYFFVVNETTSATLNGFMPKGKGFGFIVQTVSGQPTDIGRTIAHELGHGAFHLEHYPSENPNGNTSNLMDYSVGNKLSKYQWDQIHDPQEYIGLYNENTSSESNTTTSAEDLVNAVGYMLGEGSVIICKKCDSANDDHKNILSEIGLGDYRCMAFKPDPANMGDFLYSEDAYFLKNRIIANGENEKGRLFNYNENAKNDNWGIDEMRNTNPDQFMVVFYKEGLDDGSNIFQYCGSTGHYLEGPPDTFCTVTHIESEDIIDEANQDIDDNGGCHLDPDTGELEIDPSDIVENVEEGDYSLGMDAANLKADFAKTNLFAANEPLNSGVDYVYDGETLYENHVNIGVPREITDPAEIRKILNRLRKNEYFSKWDVNKWNGWIPNHVSLSVAEGGKMKTEIWINDATIVMSDSLNGSQKLVASEMKKALLEKVDTQIGEPGSVDGDFYAPFSEEISGEYHDPGVHDGEMKNKDVNIFTYLLEGGRQFRYIVEHQEMKKELWDDSDIDKYNAQIFNVYSTVAGGVDGLLTPIKDVVEMFKLIKEFVNEPQKTYSSVKEAVVNMTIEDIKKMIFMAAGDLVENSTKGNYTRAKTVTVIAIEIATATGLLKLTGGPPPSGQTQNSMLGIVMEVLDRIREIMKKVNNQAFSDALNQMSLDPVVLKILKSKFADDFYDNIDDFVIFFNTNPSIVHTWKKLADLGDGKKWVRQSKHILSKFDGLDAATLEKLKTFYKSFSPNGPYPTTRHGIEFDKYGFVKFADDAIAPISNKKYFSETLDGLPSGQTTDYSDAAEWFVDNNPNATLANGGQGIVVNGDYYTMHHMQDGKTIMPVKQSVHFAQGASHTGGASLIRKGLKGIFEIP